MHYVIHTLGFHAGHVIRRLFKLRLQRVERITVVNSGPIVRAVQRAFTEVVGFCNRVHIPIPKLLDTSIEDPATSIHTTYKEIAKNSRRVADPSEGMRVLVTTTLPALINRS